jgi:hypothetical protein
LITFTINIEELENGMMCVFAESRKDGDMTTKEAITYKRLEQKITLMIKDMSDGSSRSICAEGDSAIKVRDIMRKKGRSDRDGE